MTLPPFLRRLEDANFHLLSPLEAGEVRMAAADVTTADGPFFCRLFELNVTGIGASDDAATQLYWGIQPDDISFENSRIVLEREIGGRDEFRLELTLDGGRGGRYFDCEIIDGQSTEQIKAATDELVGRGEVIWQPLP